MVNIAVINCVEEKKIRNWN